MIEKPASYKPKYGEWFFYVTANREIYSDPFENEAEQFYFYNSGNCFKTGEEITAEIKEHILKEMKGKYENEC